MSAYEKIITFCTNIRNDSSIDFERNVMTSFFVKAGKIPLCVPHLKILEKKQLQNSHIKGLYTLVINYESPIMRHCHIKERNKST